MGGPGAQPPPVLEVTIRRLRLDRDDDKALCSTFDCGTEEWEVQVSDFIVRKIWLPGREAEDTLLAVTSGGDMFGFGATKFTTVELPQRADDPVPAVRVAYFGVASAFKGAVDADGRKWASRLYSTVEADARERAESPDIPFELFCDRRNERGLRFWTDAKRGFQIIGPAYADLMRLVRMPPPA